MMFTKEELLDFNETMLGRGVPNSDDGVGYNKADYSTCALYFYGISDSQYADLAKRLVKYCNTQLGVERDKMVNTAKELGKICDIEERVNGVSINIEENETAISFKYNKDFVNVIKKQKKRRYDALTKMWFVPNELLIKTLQDLCKVGADVKNAIEYAESKSVKKSVKEPVEVLVKRNDDAVLLKFDYDEKVLNEIRNLDKSHRQWNSTHKFWAISLDKFEDIRKALEGFTVLKEV